MSKILITGATGTIGTNLTRHLKDEHELVLADIDFSSFPEELKKGVEIIQGDLTELEAWEGLLDDAEYVIQLAANPDPDADFYDDLVGLNYVLPQNLYKKALNAPKLKRIIFASSIHASDAYPDGVQVKTTDQVRPDDLYGVSKAYLEALASYYAFNKNIESIGIRIGDYKPDESELDPESDFNDMAMYFSARDMNHLIDCCLATPLEEPFLLVNGLSNNTFPRLDIHSARVKLGYQPQDNAFEKLNWL
ncbi:NAD(P)-dependent oxidoreductase [Alkalibacterium sp. 20]|uniref:NAD-dependent epimerase/dehydratase family protein n=1 Tax=Alkalibacterium sp. 20 TaxID=1798803 RepID=UPI00090048E5|nr:NAD(P)-dependent oxidoreductase [Alkalibacterium sp. 20]OJF93035.1 nucleoside-diphosphate sugar epimerase [Alkalibacterium sp. 20]